MLVRQPVAIVSVERRTSAGTFSPRRLWPSGFSFHCLGHGERLKLGHQGRDENVLDVDGGPFFPLPVEVSVNVDYLTVVDGITTGDLIGRRVTVSVDRGPISNPSSAQVITGQTRMVESQELKPGVPVIFNLGTTLDGKPCILKVVA